MRKILRERDRVLNLLSGKSEGFYLGGGTALSMFYFQHRESFDIDFFTKEFSMVKINRVMLVLSGEAGMDIKLNKADLNQRDRAKVAVYYLKIDKNNFLKIDFIEDAYDLIKPFKIIDGISILSKEDIYARKIYASCGCYAKEDVAGKRIFIGGRQEAKDFFDLYFLSTAFMPLSKFAARYCSETQRESMVVWYRTYDRVSIKLGLNDIVTDKEIGYRAIEMHFKNEIEKIIRAGME